MESFPRKKYFIVENASIFGFLSSVNPGVVDNFVFDSYYHRLISVIDVRFTHDTMLNRPSHILSYATMPCQILF